MTVRPAREVGQVLTREAVKIVEKGVVSGCVDTRHTMSPAKHSVAAEQKWHQKNVGALGLLHDGRSLQKHHRAWGSPGESKLCDVGVSAGSGRAWSSLDMMGTSVQCDRRFSRCEKPLFGQVSSRR